MKGKNPVSRAKKRNPGATSVEQWVRAVNTVCSKKNERAGICSRSNEPEVLEARDLIRNTPPADRARFGREQAAKRRRRNPDQEELDAIEKYTEFHGRPPAGLRTVTEELRYPSALADLGSLVELQAILRGGDKLAVIGFRGKGVRVACTPNGLEIHFVGGKQSLNLADIQCEDQEGKPNVIVGLLHRITYDTSKSFHNFERSDYEHELGEETGDKPVLAYDPRSEKLYLVGGAYDVRPEGIVN